MLARHESLTRMILEHPLVDITQPQTNSSFYQGLHLAVRALDLVCGQYNLPVALVCYHCIFLLEKMGDCGNIVRFEVRFMRRNLKFLKIEHPVDKRIFVLNVR